MGIFSVLSLGPFSLPSGVIVGSFSLGYGFWLFSSSSSSSLSVPQQLCPLSPPKASLFSSVIPSIPLQLFPRVPRTQFWLLMPLPPPSAAVSLCPGESLAPPEQRVPSPSQASALRPGSEPGCFSLYHSSGPSLCLRPLPWPPLIFSSRCLPLTPPRTHHAFGFGPSPPPARPPQGLPQPPSQCPGLGHLPGAPFPSPQQLFPRHPLPPGAAISPIPPSPTLQQLSLIPLKPGLMERPLPPVQALLRPRPEASIPSAPGSCLPSRQTSASGFRPFSPAFPFTPMPAKHGVLLSRDARAGKSCGSGVEFLTSRFITLTAHHSRDNRVVGMASRNNGK